jgi:hypothetical protein
MKKKIDPLQREINRRQRICDKLRAERETIAKQFAALDTELVRKLQVQRVFIEALQAGKLAPKGGGS